MNGAPQSHDIGPANTALAYYIKRRCSSFFQHFGDRAIEYVIMYIL